MVNHNFSKKQFSNKRSETIQQFLPIYFQNLSIKITVDFKK